MGSSQSKPSEAASVETVPLQIPQTKKRSDPRPIEIGPQSFDYPENDDIPDPTDGNPCALYIEGLSPHWILPHFEKFLTTHQIKFKKAYKRKMEYAGTVYFNSNEDRNDCYKKLNGFELKKKKLYVSPKFRSKDLTQQYSRRVVAQKNEDLKSRTIAGRVVPWLEIPYDEQIAKKAVMYKEIVAPIIGEDAEPIQILRAPKLNNFRNKIECTVGYDFDHNIQVGYNLGSRTEDIVVPIDDCLNYPVEAPRLASMFRDFVRESPCKPFDRIMHTGSWKFILIRCNEKEEYMFAAITFGAIPEEEVNRFREAFKDQVASLYWIETTSFESYGEKTMKQYLLAGTPTIIAENRGIKFEISPCSFFQTNTEGNDILFGQIEEFARVGPNTVLMDVCCGTGVIGLSMAKKVKAVYGIDIEKSAIEDAKKNADYNGITNSEFYAAPAEKLLSKILEEKVQPGDEVICVVDPPRSGLNSSALMAIRDCPNIRRLVYVSCNPHSLVRDCKTVLMNSTDFRQSVPFSPVAWRGVDMFPHTDRLELVVLMER